MQASLLIKPGKIKKGDSISLVQLWSLGRSSWYNFISDTEIDTIILKEKAIKKFNDHISVNEDKLSGLITISTTFQDPIIASDIANYIGNQVEKYIYKKKTLPNQQRRKFLYLKEWK